MTYREIKEKLKEFYDTSNKNNVLLDFKNELNKINENLLVEKDDIQIIKEKKKDYFGSFMKFIAKKENEYCQIRKNIRFILYDEDINFNKNGYLVLKFTRMINGKKCGNMRCLIEYVGK